MKNIFTILFLIFSFSVFGQDNRTSLSFSNIASLQGLVGSPGLAVTTQGFRNPGDGGGGRFRWNAASTATPIPGFIVKNPAVSTGRWERDMTGPLNPVWAGADPTGALDNAALFNQIFNIPNTYWLLPSGTFRLSNTVVLTASNIIIAGQGMKATFINADPSVGNIFYLNTDSISNVTIQNMKIQCNFVLDRSSGADTGISIITWFSTIPVTSAITARDLHFSNLLLRSPYGCVDGIDIFGQRGSFGGGITKDFYITDCLFDSIGKSGIGILGGESADHHNPYCTNGFVNNCTFRNLGGKSQYGFAISMSEVSNIKNSNLTIEGAKVIGIENAGGEYITTEHVRMSKSKSKCLPYTVQNNDNVGFYKSGNSVTDFIVTDSIDVGPQIAWQDGFNSKGNKVLVDSTYTDIENVKNSHFIGDYYSASKSGQCLSLANCIGNTFTSSVIVGSQFGQVLTFRAGSKRNDFSLSNIVATPPGFIIATFDSATDNVINRNHSGFGNPNGAVAGIIGDTYTDITNGQYYFKSAGNSYGSMTGWAIIQSPWNRSGNYIFPSNLGTDSVGIGINIPQAKLDVNGQVNIENPDTTTNGGTKFGLNVSMSRQVPGSTTNFVGNQVGMKVGAGDSLINGYYYRTNVFNPVGIIGHGFSFLSQGGTFTNINVWNHFFASDMTIGSGGLGNVTAYQGQVSAKTGSSSFNLYMDGTAPNYLNGPLWMGATAATPSAQLFMNSTTQGFKPPSMTTTQKLAIASPSEGLQVYDLTLHQMSYYNGTAWVNF